MPAENGTMSRGEFYSAVARQEVDAVEKALRAGQDPNAQYLGKLPLNVVVLKGNERLLELLISNGLSIDVEAGIQMANAAHLGFSGIVRRFLDAGVSPNATNRRRVPAIVMARHQGHEEIVHMLLQAGAEDVPIPAALGGGVPTLDELEQMFFEH